MFIVYSDAPVYAYILAIVCIAAGLTIATGGYRFRDTTMFASALFVAGDYVVMLLFAMDDIFLANETWYYLSFFIAGLVFGAISLMHTKTGIFITGFCAGVLLTTMIMRMANANISIGVVNAMMTVSGLSVAVLTLYTKKRGFVVATSFIGASVFMSGMGFFVNKSIASDYNNGHMSSQAAFVNNMNEFYDKLESAWWAMTAIQLALAVVAVVVQLLLIARDIDLDNVEPQIELSAGTTQYAKVQTPQTDVKTTSAEHSVSLV